jgi:hypothetical protein
VCSLLDGNWQLEKKKALTSQIESSTQSITCLQKSAINHKVKALLKSIKIDRYCSTKSTKIKEFSVMLLHVYK